ncbi:hypothetical protein AHiyo4_24500 [Arthrobacter sp. Hiyo4]|nr:hypothetical protein AHiyo4_24500 [Arthrobacter sp. Hiyo4]
MDADGPRVVFPVEPLFKDLDRDAFLKQQGGEIQTHGSAADDHHVSHRDGPDRA